MVGAGVEVFFQPRRDLVGRAVGHHRVDQAVAAWPGDFVLGETQPLPVVAVIGQVEINVERLAADRAGLLRVGGQHHLVLGRQERRRADQFAGLRGVLRSGQVGVRAGAALRRKLQHPRAQRRDHPTIGGDAVVVELVEVVHQRVVGLAVFGDRLGMPDADTQQEAARVGLVDAVERLGHRLGGRRPDVDDAGGHLQRGRRFEDGLHPLQLGGR